MTTALDSDIKALQDGAALKILRNSYIRVTILTSGLQFNIDVRDIVRWERQMIKKGIYYLMEDLHTGTRIAWNTINDGVQEVPEDYHGRT